MRLEKVVSERDRLLMLIGINILHDVFGESPTTELPADWEHYVVYHYHYARGTVSLYQLEDKVIVNNLCIFANSRRKGYGTRLLKEVLAMAGDRKVALSVLETNAAARALYTKMGFVEIDRGECYGKVFLRMEHPGKKK